MASLIPTSEITVATGILGDHFDTFANDTIIVYKEPIATVTAINDSPYYGYENGDGNSSSNITYTAVYASFPAMVMFGRANIKEPYMHETNVLVPDGLVRIKVKEDAKNYINNGKTERIEINGQSYNIVSNLSHQSQNFLGLRFFYYTLQSIT